MINIFRLVTFFVEYFAILILELNVEKHRILDGHYEFGFGAGSKFYGSIPINKIYVRLLFQKTDLW